MTVFSHCGLTALDDANLKTQSSKSESWKDVLWWSLETVGTKDFTTLFSLNYYTLAICSGRFVYIWMCECTRLYVYVYVVMWDWCYSLFYFSDRGILRDGNGPHGYSDHGAWCFSSWERYWLSLASDRPTATGLGWTQLHYMLFVCQLCAALFVNCLFICQWIFLQALPVCFACGPCFVSLLICLFGSVLVHCWVLGNFPLWAVFNNFYSKNGAHSARELHY